MDKKPKNPYTFRLSHEHIDFLTKYQTGHSLANTTEALEQILTALPSSVSPAGKEPSSSGPSDLFPCKQRVTIPIKDEKTKQIENQLTCMNPPTLYHKIKITEITPEICRACQVLSKNLPDKYAIKETPTQETFDRPREPIITPATITDPKTDLSKAGMRYCRDGGLWVFANKCEMCRAKNYAVWYDCQKQKYRQKGEQLAAVQRGSN